MQHSLSIVMPCLNEAETIEECITKAQEGLSKADIRGEIIIADNGSTDNSVEIAKRCGAKVVLVIKKGYGNALKGGIEAASSNWILMGDADQSYDFSDISKFVSKLKEGNDLVMGCRLPAGGGKILPGAMPWKNRWIGNPVLSLMGRFLFKTPIKDFHCGMRAFTKEAYRLMDLQTTGMEFASEMVLKATLWKMRVAEVPITLHPDGSSRPPHLRPWRDGWRHLRFMLIYSPRWLLLIPGLILSFIGLIGMIVLYQGPLIINHVVLDSGTMMMLGMALLLGVQLSGFAISTKIFGMSIGLMPEDKKIHLLLKYFNLEKGLLLGTVTMVTGFLFIGNAFFKWKAAGFGPISYAENLRNIIPGATLGVLGIQLIFISFFLSVLGLRTSKITPPN